MHFQWYPGHMTKAKRMMQENMKLVDLVIELVDARIPLSSRNPDIDELGKNKARLILLNKADLAEERWNDAWEAYFRDRGYLVAKVRGCRKIKFTEDGNIRLRIWQKNGGMTPGKSISRAGAFWWLR